jgi:Spy/CpxP family protein refolding chaperone
MKKTLSLIIVITVVTGAAAWAHCGNCPGDKPKTEVKGGSGTAALEKLNLTDEQKAKIADLKKECAKATSKAECQKTCAAGLEKILTPEQFKEWQAACQPAQCPMGGKK